ncbi:hypothetical protein FGO68_gene14602 [Halteria grandinella]|uniref:Uncharacterized protein n=1 Tax=Halteria grandinella TaxID=5974 RepID=A0A8J8NIU3_HALGN|nr:hypothetical protein FGO68_gene14602 [Halteria grandinella]
MIEVAGLFESVFQNLFGPRGLRQLAHRDHVRPRLDDLLDFDADLAQIDIQILEHIRRYAAAFLDEAQQQMFGTDIIMIEPLGFRVCQLHHPAGPVGEPFVHVHDTLLSFALVGVLDRFGKLRIIPCPSPLSNREFAPRFHAY